MNWYVSSELGRREGSCARAAMAPKVRSNTSRTAHFLMIFILALDIRNTHPRGSHSGKRVIATRLPHKTRMTTSPFHAIHPPSRLDPGAVCAKNRKEGARVSLERIEITPFAVILCDVVQGRRTGHLTIVRTPMRKVLYWSQGELVLATSGAPEDSLGDFLVRRGVLTPDRAIELTRGDDTEAVAHFNESGWLELSLRQALLREWLTGQFVPLFSLDEGTAAFTDDPASQPDKRVYLQPTPAPLRH